MRAAFGRAAVALAFCSSALAQPSAAAIDRAFERFWKAANTQAAQRTVPALLQSGVGFEDAYARLRAGRPFPEKPGTGELTFSSPVSDGRARSYLVVVPDDLKSDEVLPVRFQLHGGVNRPVPEEGEPARRGRRRTLDALREIVVYPSADREAPWWSFLQVEALAATLDRLKRSHRVDTNHVYLTGISDGATGAYYVAQRDTTPWSSFLPLNGQMRVLSNATIGVEGDVYVRNLANKPFFIVNGGRDPLYPASGVAPMLDLFRRAGVSLVFEPQPDAGHDVSWWPQVKDEFAAFVRDHPRDPLPDRLAWETDQPGRFGRAHWLVIDALGATPGDATFDDFDEAAAGPRDFGMRVDVERPGAPRVSDVAGGSDAQRLGLERGDVVVEADGKTIASSAQLLHALQGYAMGAPLRVVVERKGARVPLQTVLEPDPPERLFRRTRASGRVELQKRGNIVELKTRGVRRVTLLLSPDRFDFAQPVKLSVNGRPAFEGRVERSLETLLSWASRDDDPAMLFGAELHVAVPERKEP
jgi:hypothetical protein